MKNRLNITTDTKTWFNRWSNKYDCTLGSISFHKELLDLIVRNSGVKAGDRILDIGCGTGLLSLKLLRKKNCFITGVDCSEEMTAIFKDKIKRLKLKDVVSVNLMDAASLKFEPGTFDIVVSSVTLHHLKHKLPALKTIFRILKSGGIFIVGEVDMDTTGKHTDPGRLKRILRVLEQEYIPALKDAGVEALFKMYDNGRKHILNEGEYCVSLRQWAALCRKAGFAPVGIKRVSNHKCFGIVSAKKP
ncbi:MAG: methyltransferase domain-containing protein [Candidatus Omnitrophica bacterium]|nr:methyltransferase domain-containing protein [Candidatus Omnitrophota bacterium]